MSGPRRCMAEAGGRGCSGTEVALKRRTPAGSVAASCSGRAPAGPQKPKPPTEKTPFARLQISFAFRATVPFAIALRRERWHTPISS